MSVIPTKSQDCDLVVGPAGSEVAHAGKTSLTDMFSRQPVSSAQLHSEGDSAVSENKGRSSSSSPGTHTHAQMQCLASPVNDSSALQGTGRFCKAKTNA